MDFKEIVEAGKTAGMPSAVLVALLMVAGVCWGFNKLMEATLASGNAKRAKFDWLVESLGKPTVQKSRYLVEQVYARYIGSDAIDYDDLEALLKRKAPSVAVAKFAAYRRFIQIRHDNSEFEYRPGYAGRWRRFLLKTYYLATYVATGGIAGMSGLLLYNQHLLFSSVLSAGPFILLIWGIFALNRYTDLAAAIEFMEPDKQGFWPKWNAIETMRRLPLSRRKPAAVQLPVQHTAGGGS